MSRANAERLNLAIQDARKALGDSSEIADTGSKKAKSKINQLLGKKRIKETKRPSILSKRVTSKNSEYDLISNSILGKESENYQPIVKIQHESDNFSEKFSRRIEKMRERAFSPLSKVSDGKFTRSEIIGRESDGVEVWRSFVHDDLNHHIPELRNALEEPANNLMTNHDFENKGLDSNSNFRNWIEYSENENASAIAQSCVRSPNKMNPILFWGPVGVGKTHILNCVGNGFVSRQEGNVRVYSNMEIENGDFGEIENIDAVSKYSLLGFDGIDSEALSEKSLAKLGNIIDLAINLGIQVVATSRSEPNEWNKSRIWELFNSGTSVPMVTPSLTSRISIIRKMASKDGILLDNSQIMLLSDFSENWRDLKSKYYRILNAIEDGISVTSASDVEDIINGNATRIEPTLESRTEPIEKIATSMINSALDVVFDKEAVGGIELQTELPELEDDWEPSELDLEKMIKDDRILAEKYIKVGLDEMIPAPPNVLSVHERDQHLIKREENLETIDVEKVVNTMVDIDINLEEKILAAERQLSDDFAVIAELEKKIGELSRISENASVEELIELADSIKEMEDKIMGQTPASLDPEIEPLDENQTSSEFAEKVETSNPEIAHKKITKPKRKKRKKKSK